MNCTAQLFSGHIYKEIKSGKDKKPKKKIECICKRQKAMMSTPKRCELCGENIH